VLGDRPLDRGAVAAGVRADDEQRRIRATDLRNCRHEVFQPLAGMNAAEECDDGPVPQVRVFRPKRAAGGKLGAFRQVDAERFDNRAGAKSKAGTRKPLGIGRVVDGRSPVQISPQPPSKVETFLPSLLGKAPGVKHPVRRNDIRQPGALAKAGRFVLRVFPKCVNVDDVAAPPQVFDRCVETAMAMERPNRRSN
jgi:hypothetical protein